MRVTNIMKSRSKRYEVIVNQCYLCICCGSRGEGYILKIN